jgi:hypothetical protein
VVVTTTTNGAVGNRNVGGLGEALGVPRTAEFDREALAALLKKQHGVVSREQVRQCQMTGRQVRYRTRAGGPWQALLPGVYLAHSGTPASVQREMAALLYGGPDSVITGPAALRRHNLPAPDTGTVNLLVPLEIQRHDAKFAQLQRTARMPGRHCVEGAIRYVLPPRAVADTARGLGELGEVRAVVAGAVQRRKCPVARLAEELRQGPVRGSALLRQALAEVVAGIRSSAEGDLLDLITWARLPMPMFNPRLTVDGAFVGMPDCWWPAAGVAVEVDSREWHLSPQDWEETMRRHALMSASGIVVLHFTPGQIRGQRRSVATTIKDTLAANSDRFLPRIAALPAT